MLTLTRRVGERITLGTIERPLYVKDDLGYLVEIEPIEIELVKGQSQRAQIGFVADRRVKIVRTEVAGSGG